jgi:hypothetical protein
VRVVQSISSVLADVILSFPVGYFQGSVIVSSRAKTFLESMGHGFHTSVCNLTDGFIVDKLRNSRYGVPDDVAHITDCFDKTTKLGFKDPSQPAFIRFGTTKDSDQTVDVRFGQLKLQG